MRESIMVNDGFMLPLQGEWVVCDCNTQGVAAGLEYDGPSARKELIIDNGQLNLNQD